MNRIFKDNETIMDGLYGLIKISSFEKSIICSPEFQRLRGIKQLGFVYLVYPTAEHSRFVHSIGVCHQSKKIIDQINENIRNNSRYQKWSGINNETISFKEQNKITEIERIVIAATALIHDISHGPFSHELESAVLVNDKGIPHHDDFEHNPALFTYLFDSENSTLAKIINYYNDSFLDEIKADEKWKTTFQGLEKEKKLIKGRIKYKSLSSKSNNTKSKRLLELPILGILMFEILLFDDDENWYKDYHSSSDQVPLNHKRVVCDWENSYIEWAPLLKWHRHYRKDIICDTICADLMDFIQRDGQATGIISSLDLKFLDRMVIAKTLSFQTVNKENYSIVNIPDCYEHVVFDIYDYKRKLIRESIITELISCLQVRYQLFERVYNHRVVEGAKSMLQRIVQLLCEINFLNTKILYDLNSTENIKPIDDISFLNWVLSLPNQIKDKNNSENIDKNILDHIQLAAELATMIKRRRIYRELMIINGFNSSNSDDDLYNRKGIIDKRVDTCKELSKSIKNAISKNLFNEILDENSLTLNTHYQINLKLKQKLPTELLLFGFSKFGSKYKIPNFFIVIPENKSSKEIKITLLKEIDNPLHIKEMLDSIELAYYSLWKVYIFVHPAFFNKSLPNINEKLKGISNNFEIAISERSSVSIKNSIEDYFGYSGPY
jgi:HD superfamily phosphohydrolase